jgi:peptidoglycan-N-acetylmuramic acid deacetylase
MKKILLFGLILIILAVFPGCKYQKANPSVPNPSQVNVPPQELPQPAPAVTPPAVNPANNLPSAQAKSFSWWFTRNQQHQTPSINKDVAQMLAENNGFYILPNNSKKIYLTFDEGYELAYTPTILDILDRKQVKAAFFITGQFIQTQPELVKRMQESGHLVCNHTWNHADLPTLSQDKFNQEIKSLEHKYSELTGSQMAPYLRPPMGNYSATTLKWAKDLGYTSVFWSIAFEDWDPNKQPGTEYSYKHLMDNIHPGAVILLHAVSKSDTEALEKIISDLQAQGYVFSTFDK